MFVELPFVTRKNQHFALTKFLILFPSFVSLIKRQCRKIRKEGNKQNKEEEDEEISKIKTKALLNFHDDDHVAADAAVFSSRSSRSKTHDFYLSSFPAAAAAFLVLA